MSRPGRHRTHRHRRSGRRSASSRKPRCSRDPSDCPSAGEAGSPAGRGPAGIVQVGQDERDGVRQAGAHAARISALVEAPRPAMAKPSDHDRVYRMPVHGAIHAVGAAFEPDEQGTPSSAPPDGRAAPALRAGPARCPGRGPARCPARATHGSVPVSSLPASSASPASWVTGPPRQPAADPRPAAPGGPRHERPRQVVVPLRLQKAAQRAGPRPGCRRPLSCTSPFPTPHQRSLLLCWLGRRGGPPKERNGATKKQRTCIEGPCRVEGHSGRCQGLLAPHSGQCHPGRPKNGPPRCGRPRDSWSRREDPFQGQLRP